MKIIVSLLLAFLFLPATAHADAFNRGKVAYDHENYTEALKIWQPLAGHGNARAQFYLGDLYANGLGVKQDTAEALKWRRAAADQGSLMAQYSLGEMYALGEGVPRDDVKAARWYRLAADQGDADAETALARMYAQGEGVTKDRAAAMDWLRKAADHGDTGAAVELADMYHHGKPSARDDEEAAFWYAVASRPYGGDPFGYPVRADKTAAESSLTGAQLAAVRKRVKAWNPAVVSAAASGKACTNEKALRADTAAEDFKNWKAVYLWYREFGSCDRHHGEASEYLEDTVGRLLAGDKKSLPRLARLTRKHNGFRRFVLSYIDKEMSAANKAAARKNLKQYCTAEGNFLCKDISERLDASKTGAGKIAP